MSLYANYVAEHTHGEVLETPEGFATYVFPDEKTVYIKEIYTIPERRKNDVATLLADQIVEIARLRGCTRLLGSVCPSAKGSTASIKVLFARGFELDSASNDFILFRKDI